MQASSDHRQRAYWLKTLHEWHWVSSAICLIGLLLFAVTGFTLNHAAEIEGKPKVVSQKGTIPPAFFKPAEVEAAVAAKKAPLPATLQEWLSAEWSLETAGRVAEWNADEIYLSLPRPGGDAWVRIALPGGEAEYEVTDRGWISYLNDLHKGRHTGTAWRWFLDIFAAGTLVFSITGLFILKLHATRRPFTWPMVGLGLAIPALLAILFIH